MHFAESLDVVVQLHDADFVGEKRRAEFVESPGEIIAIIVERIVSVLTGVEAALILV